MNPFDEGSVPPGTQQSPGALLAGLQRAVRDGDRGALARRAYRLDGALRKFDGKIFRSGFDLDDVRQDLLLKLLQWASKHPERVLDEPDHYVTRAVTNHLRSLVTERKVETEARGHAALRANLEDSGLYSLRDLAAAAELEGELIRARSQFAEYVETYAELARKRGGTETASQSVRCWALRDVQRLPAAEVARQLGVADRAGGGTQTIWKWTERGRELVLEIATWDAQHNPERARVMRDAALGVE